MYGYKLLGCSQAVRHQTLTLAFSMVRIHPAQPKQKRYPRGISFVLLVLGVSRNIIPSQRLGESPESIQPSQHKRDTLAVSLLCCLIVMSVGILYQAAVGAPRSECASFGGSRMLGESPESIRPEKSTCNRKCFFQLNPSFRTG